MKYFRTDGIRGEAYTEVTLQLSYLVGLFFKDYKNVSFYVETNIKEIVKKSDVIISCITEADGLLCGDDSLFREGCEAGSAAHS